MKTIKIGLTMLLVVAICISFVIPISAASTMDFVNVKDLGALGDGLTEYK